MFCPPQTRVPAPKGIRYCDILHDDVEDDFALEKNRYSRVQTLLLGLASVQRHPSFWEEGVGTREHLGNSVHAPGLSGDDGTRRECVTHHVKVFIDACDRRRRALRYNTLEKGGDGAVQSET